MRRHSNKKRVRLGTIFTVIWKTERNVIFTVVGILLVALALIGGLYSYRQHQPSTGVVRGRFERSLDDPVSEQRVYDIASHFECVACGVCKNMPLETCTCSFAVEARDVIRGKIIAQTSDESIIARVNEQFGGLEGMPSTQANSTS